MSTDLLCLLIPLLPLLGFIINGLGFRKVPTSLVGIVGLAGPVLSFICVCLLWRAFQAGDNAVIKTILFDWISVGNFHINFSFQIDQLTMLMLSIVTGIGSLIHLYSIGYMHHDEGYGKFMAFLNLFLFFMLLLVLGSNFVIMFIGWEGVGLCSYLLIGFWNTNTSYNNAARKAFVMNRIGDLGFLLGIFTIMATFGSVEYTDVFTQAVGMEVNDKVILAITLLLFVGAMGKSAQIPLYTWLPDAMAGPTPVSALIHAATMVTAGIYMVVTGQCAVLTGSAYARYYWWYCHCHCPARRLYWPVAERHQESAGLLDRVAIGLYVHGAGRYGLHGQHVSRHYARVFQGPAIPGCR